MTDALFETHRKMLEGALSAIERRTYWTPFPEIPSGKIYGEKAKDDGLAAFQDSLNRPFVSDQPGRERTSKSEVSPYGMRLGITYPKPDLDELLPAVQKATRSWGDAPIETRVGVCLEILSRLGRNAFQMANALMHTTGQSYMMAFQAGGPHALDRALEAVAYSYREMTRCPHRVTWEKQVGKNEVVRLEKVYYVVPRGIAALIGCSTFPTWNGYPGLFSSLATGNAVVVKPHHAAVLPLALAVETARAVLRESGFDPNVITLFPNGIDGESVSKALVMRPEIRIVDYTGGNEFGDWLQANCSQAVVFAEKAGVNPVILDSVDDLKAVAENIAFSLALYSGQMCTAPQNIYLPKGGIRCGGDRVGFDDAARAIVGALDRLLSEQQRAVEVLGAIQSQKTVERIQRVASGPGEILRRSQRVPHERFPDARIHSPLMIKVRADQREVYMHESFGPISFIIETKDTAQSIELAALSASEQGAITSLLYSVDGETLRNGQAALVRAGVPVSCNLTGQVFVNQAAAFSDFHVSGANPAGNATLCDGAFVANRFRMVHTRVPL